LLAWGMQLLTAPVSAHMIGRAGYRTKHAAKDSLYADELKQVVDKVSNSPATGAIEVSPSETKESQD